MSKKNDKNLYEILDIPHSAQAQEIEEAYQRARRLYGEDSVAVYSLYSPEEREAMMKDVITAYETLKDPAKRKDYDTRLITLGDSRHVNGKKLRAVEAETLRMDRRPSLYEKKIKASLKKSLVVMDDADPVAIEQYRILYTKLERLGLRDEINTFAVTSAVKGEGKTVTSLNLAYVIASEFKKKTILVECDLRNPTLSLNHLDTFQKGGLTSVLRGEMDLEDAIAKMDEENFYVLPAIHGDRRSSELLNSLRMKEVIEKLKSEFDYVLLDSPPILHVADMNIINKRIDGMVLVVKAGQTPKDVVLKAVGSLTDANIVGVVLNCVDIELSKYNYSY